MERIGPYEVLEVLARGGMGVVARARDLRDGRTVALKVPSGDVWRNEAQRTRFLREIEALSRLDHPHVVRVLEAGQADGTPFLAMELVDGPSLEQHLAGRSGPLAPGEAAELVRKLARAAAHAHRLGILHRDIKPGNVLLSGGEPLLTDFGLARVLEGSELTRTGQLMGTPGFAAPELIRGALGEVGPATDVYGLGATLYALLTGLPPARGDTLPEVLEATLERAPPPPGRLCPGIDPALERLCLACLAKDPARRPPTAEALADELERWLRGEAPLGRSSRAPLLAGAILLAGVALALALAWTRAAGRGATTGSPPGDAASAGPATPEVPAPASPEVAVPATAESPAPAPVASGPRTASGLTDEASRRLAAGDPDGAIEAASRAIALDPRHAAAWRVRADARRRRGALEDAIADLDRAIELEPTLLARFVRGKAYMDLGRLEKALEDFSRVLERDPRYAGAFTNRGLIRSRQGDKAGALADFTQALAIDPGQAGVRVNLANLRIASGDPKGALEELDAALAIDAHFPLALLIRGRLHLRQGAIPRGLHDLGHAIEVASGPPVEDRWGASVTQEQVLAQALLARAKALEDKGDVRAAKEDVERLAVLRPEDPETWNVRGLIRGQLGDPRGAVEDHTRAIELNPREPAYRINRGIAQSDPALAEADFTAAIACATPGSTNLGLAHYNRGNSRAGRGDQAGGLEDLLRAGELLPRDARVFKNRGTLRRAMGDLPGAVADHTRVIELEPKNHWAWWLRAGDRAAMEDWPRALEDVEEGLRRAPAQPELLLLRGQVRLRLGQVAGATEDLTRAVERLPAGSPQAAEARALLEEARGAPR